MIPAFNNDNFECAKLHLEFDKGFFCAAEKAVRLVIDLTNDVREPLFFDTMAPRMLFVVQSMACIVALPFKMINAFFLGLMATVADDNGLKIGAMYAIASVGVYAVAIPTGFILACQPTSELKGMGKAAAAFGMFTPQQWVAVAQQHGLRMMSQFFGRA
jgi:hypothetical protein